MINDVAPLVKDFYLFIYLFLLECSTEILRKKLWRVYTIVPNWLGTNPGEHRFRRCDVCVGRACSPFRVTAGENVVMQRCLHKRRSDCGRLL